MLEPLIVLTALNCIFMFSSTVTSCALWWQYQNHHCCARKTAPQSRADLKKSKSYILRTAKKPSEKSDLAGNGDINNVVSNSNRNSSSERKSKKCHKKRSKKSLTYAAEYQKKSEEMSLPNNKARIFDEKTNMSEASQTINDTKSTVVMEFSAVQKVVQIVDDSDVNSTRPSFMDIIIQKNTTDKKRDYHVEQKFESNLANTKNP